jgi:serine/threonine-protein kinase
MWNSAPVAFGQVIASKYRVDGVLGEGGMGLVLAAWHLGLEQKVAIKLLLSQMLEHDSSARERFQREARAAARIRSEHVCRVLDTGNLDDGTPFLVMEYLEGADLSEELRLRGRFEPTEAVTYLRQACEGLGEAHRAGVIHRDLKPANLFLVQRPDGERRVKVLDFGVSKSLSSSGTPHLSLTKTSSLVGSPIYMSPEQLNSSKDVDGRTDIWALGCILYELLTGRTPFQGETMPQLVHAVLHSELPSFESLGVAAPEGLEQVVRRALSRPREERYASTRELWEALGPFAGESAGTASGTQFPLPRSTSPTPTRQSRASTEGTIDGRASGSPRAQDGVAVGTHPGELARARMRWALLGMGLVGLTFMAAWLSHRAPKPETAQRAPAAASSAAKAPAAVAPALPPHDVQVARPLAEQIAPAAADGADAGAPKAEAREAEQDLEAAPLVGGAPGEGLPPERAAGSRSAHTGPRRREHERPRPADPPPTLPATGSTPRAGDTLPDFGGRR